jgi:hypothetical protein
MTYYVPFGKDCFPAEILRYSGLRQFSLPFDWLFTTPYIIKDSLDTNFIEWFDTKKLIVPDTNKALTIHTKYKISDYTDIGMFNHHNLLDNKTQEAFKRTIDRLHNTIMSNKNIIFLTTMSVQDLNEYKLLEYFKRKAKTSFICLEWTESDIDSVNYTIYENITVIEYSSPSSSSDYAKNAISNIIQKL